MCGIIGYAGKRQAVPLVLAGLKNLEYRGYDSAGVAVVSCRQPAQASPGKLAAVKCKGRIADLEGRLKDKKLAGATAIGHTRWATHGRPSQVNAHPHYDSQRKIALVHNGIIENYSQLKAELKKSGVKFSSQTDSEVCAHLVAQFYKGNLEEAVARAVKRLKGSYALAVVSSYEPEKIVAARCDSPLVLGLGKDENFVASDTAAFLSHIKKVIYLEEGQLASLTKDKVKVFNLAGHAIPKKINTLTGSVAAAQKSGFKHFMLKEINQQPKIIGRLISHYAAAKKIGFPELKLKPAFLKGIDNMIIVACGTAYHAGLVGKYAIENLARIPVWVDLASEFRYRRPLIGKKTLVLAISQSGETADTLAAVRQAKKQGAKIISICNVLGSSLTRESEGLIYTHAGPEISVASTKAYTAQVMVLYLWGLYLANLKGCLSSPALRAALKSLKKVPGKQEVILKGARHIKSIARRHLHFGAFLYLGRNVNFPTALEGALKLKEISYIPAEGYAAGEMKHGPIALIDEYRAVVCLAPDSFIFDKMVSNIQEILAREAKIIVVATCGNQQIKQYAREIIFIPKLEEIFSPLLTIIPLQLLAYYIADLKGFDVDKPRNLAKSVTVE